MNKNVNTGDLGKIGTTRRENAFCMDNLRRVVQTGQVVKSSVTTGLTRLTTYPSTYKRIGDGMSKVKGIVGAAVSIRMVAITGPLSSTFRGVNAIYLSCTLRDAGGGLVEPSTYN